MTTSAGTLDILMESGWVVCAAAAVRRAAPSHMAPRIRSFPISVSKSIKDLPGLAELRASGLLDGNLPPDFTVPDPTDLASLMPDELPLEAGEDEDEEEPDDSEDDEQEDAAEGESLPGDEDPDKP